MSEANGVNADAENTVEHNEQEMIGEGAPVTPETDPEATENAETGGVDAEFEQDLREDQGLHAEKHMIAEGGPVSEETEPYALRVEDVIEEAASGPAPVSEPQAEVDMVAEGGAIGSAVDQGEPGSVSAEPELLGEETSETNFEELDAARESASDADLAAAEAALGGTPGEAPAEGAEEEAESFDAQYKRRLREFTRELKKQPGQWYIIQTYSGYENKVKTNLDMRIQTLEVEESIYDVVVPIEQVLETKDDKKKLVKRKLLPGYVLVRMDMNDAAWSVVRETPGVTSFVGNEGNATPVKHKEVAKFLMPKSSAAGAGLDSAANAEGETVVAMPEEQSAPKIAHDFKVGEAVTILSGALASVSATINEIDPETGKIQALVSIFGRETPVELTADQIERII